MDKIAEFHKNQCNVVFQIQRTGIQKKLTPRGTEAAERRLCHLATQIVHMASGKANMWTVHPESHTLNKFMWILCDAWDAQEYDPFEDS